MLLNEIDIFKWMQLRHAIPAKWKNIIKNDISSFQSTNGQLREQHVTHCSRNLPIDKFTSQTFYNILVNKIKEQPTAQIYIQRKFPDFRIEWPKIWPKIYFNVRQFTIDGFSRDFYFKLI